MSRFGFHPIRTSKVLNMPDAKKITITTIIHIPELIGFWKLSTKKYLVHHLGNKIPYISISYRLKGGKSIENLNFEI